MAQQVASSLGQPSQAAASRDSSPIAFKQHLLASLNDECEIMNMLSMQEWDKIAVCQFQGIEYVLICDPEPLPRSVHLSIPLITPKFNSSLAFDIQSSTTK